MELRDYLYKNRITQVDFAREMKISYKTLWGIINKESDMKLSLALRIEKATKEEVTCKELLPESFLLDLMDKNFDSKKTSDKKNNKSKKSE